MASASRWRRFAFFDRSTLSLPDEIWDDLVPSPSDKPQEQQPQSDSEEEELSSYSTYEDTERENEEYLGPAGGAAARRRMCRRLHFTCASVSFHPSLIPPPSTATASNSASGNTQDAPASFPEALLSCAPAILSAQPNTTGASAANNNNVTISSMPAYLSCGINMGKNFTLLSSSTATHNHPTLSPLNGSLAFVYCSQPSRASSPVMGKVAQQFFASCTAANTGGMAPSDASVSSSSHQQIAAAANLLGVGTLVLAFVSSRDTGFIHVVDVSMRCNPPRMYAADNMAQQQQNASSGALSGAAADAAAATTATPSPTNNSTAVPALADHLSAVSMEELEDLDGWRGCIVPFPILDSTTATKPAASITSSSAATTKLSNKDKLILEHMGKTALTEIDTTPTTAGTVDEFLLQKIQGRRISALASYSTSKRTVEDGSNIVAFGYDTIGTLHPKSKPPAAAKSKANLQNELGHLYVAVASNDSAFEPAVTTTSAEGGGVADVSNSSPSIPGLCIMVDPHLHLHTSLHGPPGNRAPNMIVYRPSATSSPKRKYTFTCIDIVPPYVVVGTTTGVTLVYTFSPLERMTNPPTASTTSTSTTTAAGGGKRPQASPYELTLRMEIPPPGTSMNDATFKSSKVKVASVKLSSSSSGLTEGADKGLPTSKAGGKQPSKSNDREPTHIFVCYRRRKEATGATTNVTAPIPASATSELGPKMAGQAAGVCCYNIVPVASASSSTAPGSTAAQGGTSVPRSRIDLDGREVPSKSVCDVDETTGQFQVCWSDGLYTYSPNARVGATPIDGQKIALCRLPSSDGSTSRLDAMQFHQQQVQGATMMMMGEDHQFTPPPPSVGYVLVATSDDKSGRDAVDIYDTTNKLCAFHVLLSPNHRAMMVGGVTTPCTLEGRKGRSSAVVITSGGAVVTLTEKDTSEKVSLLLQKNLYAAAISLAFADSYYPMADIIGLYRQHAEHLYRKGDFDASMDQYIYTIGSLEPSHVIFRFLDAPKIPLLAKYLEHLRSRNLATSVHTELLRTCYLKLNDLAAAEKIVTSSALSDNGSLAIANLVIDRPAEALATLCSLEAKQVAEALSVHGVALARALPRETAGIVMSLCDGTYSPSNLDATGSDTALAENNLFIENRPQKCDRFPMSMFTSAFIENPKLLRLVLAHCKRNHCEMPPSLRRTHLELTLEEWNAARRTGDFEMEKIRSDEAMATLTDAFAEELGDYEALVIVQMASFTKGEVLLFERLQMSSMLLERYAKKGGERERRQMLAMCRSDPELLADVLSYFVAMASQHAEGATRDDESDDDSQGEAEAILDDIKETLEMARSQGVLPPVRIARLLAGEGPGQFSSDSIGSESVERHSVPLSIALNYIGGILDESSQEIYRLKEDLKEYCRACNDMEAEIVSLLSASSDQHPEGEINISVVDDVPFSYVWKSASSATCPLCFVINSLSPSLLWNSAHCCFQNAVTLDSSRKLLVQNLDVNELYAKVRDTSDRSIVGHTDTLHAQEEFWREMGQSEDRFETIARFFGKLLIN